MRRKMPVLVKAMDAERRAALGVLPCTCLCVLRGGGRFTVSLVALITRDVYWVSNAFVR